MFFPLIFLTFTTDIDECKVLKNPCKEGTCENVIGDYKCRCPRGKHGDGKTDCQRGGNGINKIIAGVARERRRSDRSPKKKKM
jgi:hypothetical protein